MMFRRTTVLDAVNDILTSSQLSPVESLNSGDIDAETAENILAEVGTETLTIGWYWNTETMELSPDNDGNINLPNSCLKIDASDSSLEVVQRGNRLYNLTDHTYVFSKPIELTMVLALDFEELPETCRRYISKKAALIFQEKTVGDPSIIQLIHRESLEAWAKMLKEDLDVCDYNHINGSFILRRIGAEGW